MADIHGTAIVHPDARLGRDVVVGPFCTVGPEVSLADGVTLYSHIVVEGHTSIGANTTVHPFAVLGTPPQHLGYKGEPTRLEIGRNTIIREHATVNRGTAAGGGLTAIGDSCFLMTGAHVGHDCHVGDHVMLANCATLGGHVTVGDYAVLGGLSTIHQFVRIGRCAIIGGLSGAEYDVIPYGSVTEPRGGLAGLNIVGLKRRGVSRQDIHGLRAAYRLLFADEATLAERVERVAQQLGGCAPVMDIIEFLRAESARPLMVPKPRRAA